MVYTRILEGINLKRIGSLEIKRSLALITILSSLVLPVFLLPGEVKAASAVITAIEKPSIERTWDDLSPVNGEKYLNTSMLAEEVENIASAVPALVDYEVIGQSYEGRDILSIRITNEEATQQKAKTLVVAHHHGREKVTVNAAVYFMLWLVNSYGEDAQITEYIDTQEIFVIPTVNPDALDYIYNFSDHWLRKNLRPYDDDGDGLFDEDTYDDANGDGYITNYEVYEKGSGGRLFFQYQYYEGIDDDGDGEVNEDWVGHTDLNRNYDANWGITPSASLDSMSQAFAGTDPFSEPETQVFRDFAMNHRFAMSYSLHTGINATFFVTDFDGQWIEPQLYSDMWEDYEAILPEDFNYYLDYPAVMDDLQKRPAILSGGWDEWMYHERDCVAPITFEIFNNASSVSPELYYIHEDNSTHRIMAWNGIYEYFSPDEPFIEDLWIEVLPAFEYLLEQTPRLSVSLQPDLIQGSTLTASLSANSLSPLIGSLEAIEVQLTDATLLASSSVVEAGTIMANTVQLEFDSAVEGENVTVRVGNEFTGYNYFLVSFIAGAPLDPILIGGVVIAVIAVAVIIVYVTKRR